MEELIDLISYHETYKKRIAELRVDLVNFEQKLHEVNQKIAEKLDLNVAAKIQTMKAQRSPTLHPGGRRYELVEFMKTHSSVSCSDIARGLSITVNNARSTVQALVRRHLVNRDESGEYVMYSLAVHPDSKPEVGK